MNTNRFIIPNVRLGFDCICKTLYNKPGQIWIMIPINGCTGIHLVYMCEQNKIGQCAGDDGSSGIS